MTLVLQVHLVHRAKKVLEQRPKTMSLLAYFQSIDGFKKRLNDYCSFEDFLDRYRHRIADIYGGGIYEINALQLDKNSDTSTITTSSSRTGMDLYPNAIHGLCIYHLVTQPLKKLNFIHGDKPEVKGMKVTFKLWLFRWMKYDGVETEEEFQVSKDNLERWLAMLSRRKEQYLSYNAKVLTDFLNTTPYIAHRSHAARPFCNVIPLDTLNQPPPV